MESQRLNNFEEEWKKAFENNAMPPPSDMWDRIERELEEKKRRPFLFFIRPTGMVAGVAAALILVLGGLFLFNKGFLEKNSTLVEQTSNLETNKNQSKVGSLEVQTTQNKSANNIDVENPLFATNPARSEIKEGTSPKKATYLSKNKITNTLFDIQNQERIPVLSNNNLAGAFNRTASDKTFSTDNQGVDISKNATLSGQQKNELVVDLRILQPKVYQYLGSHYTLYRNKLAFEPKINEAPVVTKNDSKFWLGIQSGVSPFDPNMKLNGLNTIALNEARAYAQASNIPSGNTGNISPDSKPSGSVNISQPKNAIKSGIGINSGFAFGYKISKKLHVESGIKYLRGNSTLQSNTYAFQQNGYINTFLGDYLLQNAGNTGLKVANSPINTVVADASQFNNRYEYLMIPLQLGYEISLTKKLGINLLAGVSTDLFLQNTIANDNSFVQEKSIINSANNVYKPLNFSGLGGIRANYLISKHWQAILGSSFQQSLSSGINSSDLQMKLRLFGVNYGVNYRF
jgi:hypothetical protein